MPQNWITYKLSTISTKIKRGLTSQGGKDNIEEMAFHYY